MQLITGAEEGADVSKDFKDGLLARGPADEVDTLCEKARCIAKEFFSVLQGAK